MFAAPNRWDNPRQAIFCRLAWPINKEDQQKRQREQKNRKTTMGAVSRLIFEVSLDAGHRWPTKDFAR